MHHYKKQIFFRVWRRLVARLNGVQEAAGSIPVTRTNYKPHEHLTIVKKKYTDIIQALETIYLQDLALEKLKF